MPILNRPHLTLERESFRVERITRPEPGAPKRGHRVIAVLPAYNAERTLAATVADMPPGSVDEVILVDDGSHDVVVMIHPDYQYDSRVIPHAVGFIELGVCDVVLGSRIRSRDEALRGGMPVYKYLSNRFLTAVENFALGQNLGDFHSGFRVYRREVLERIPFEGNSDDFVFDTQFLVQAVRLGFRLGDVPVPVRYFDEASSINFRRSVKYGLSTLGVVGQYWLDRLGVRRCRLFAPKQ
jgi:hypothetical protein